MQSDQDPSSNIAAMACVSSCGAEVFRVREGKMGTTCFRHPQSHEAKQKSTCVSSCGQLATCIHKSSFARRGSSEMM